MEQQRTTIGWIRYAGHRLGLLFVSVVLALTALFPVGAQETPEPTEEVASDTLVRIEIDVPVEPVPVGDEFEARVLVENVGHLAGFDFTIEYNPDRLSVGRVDGEGQFLISSGREDMLCGDPEANGNAVTVFCNLLGPPLCLGGQPGASGSGLLGRVVFVSKGGGSTTLELAKTNLVLDDVEPCDPEDLRPQRILHRREDASVDLVGGGGVPWLVVGPIIGVVALLIGGGLVGFVWYRRRAVTSL